MKNKTFCGIEIKREEAGGCDGCCFEIDAPIACLYAGSVLGKCWIPGEANYIFTVQGEVNEK